MEHTHLKGGNNTALPVPTGNTKPEAHERAPTLMAGEMAGMQGRVRVWAPSKRVLYGILVMGVICMLIGFTLFVHGKGEHYVTGFYDLVGGGSILIAGIRNLWRPRYISTDDAGIAIAGPGGNRAFRWNELIAVKTDGRFVVLTLPVGKVKIDLMGYRKKARAELVELIESHVKLRLHSVFWAPLGALSSPQMRACRGMKELD